MINLTSFEIWFVMGSQHLYGPKTLEQVAQNSREIAQALSASTQISAEDIARHHQRYTNVYGQ